MDTGTLQDAGYLGQAPRQRDPDKFPGTRGPGQGAWEIGGLLSVLFVKSSACNHSKDVNTLFFCNLFTNNRINKVDQ